MFYIYKLFLVLCFSCLIFLDSKLIADEINLLCVKDINVLSNKNSIKDLIIKIDTDSKKIEVGGLSITADKFEISETNIKWTAENIENMYENSSGTIKGALGRFSGSLNLSFTQHKTNSKSSLNLSCNTFKMKNRKF